MKKFYLFLLGVLCLSVQAFAQRTVTGTVTDEKGQPLANVSVLVKGTTNGATTKADGTYSVIVPANGKSIMFTSVNMDPVEMVIGNNAQVNVVLKQVDKDMEEVVVTGYQTVRKKDVASAISQISAKEIENMPVANFAQAMQGRAAGVIVAAANGIPGGGLSVIVRGVGSINAGTTPLYVVDGVQLNTSDGSINTQANPLNFLNPNDIESIDVLKDAAAASIYGARAANGVVLVTTKKGINGKPKFTFYTYVGQSKELKRLEVTNTQQWFQLRQETLINAGATPASALSQALSGIGLPAGTSQGKIDSLPTYDWQDAAFGTGNIFNAEGSVQGGSENLNYYLSASYTKQTAFIKPTDFQRGAMLSKISYKINNKITIDNSINLSTFSQLGPYSTGNTGFGNAAYVASLMHPINPIYNADGTFYGLPGTGQNMIGTYNHNIIAINELVKYFTRTNQLVGNIALTYKITPQLTLRSMVGMDYRNLRDHRYRPSTVNDSYASGGNLSEQVDWNTNLITNTTASYVKTIKENHNINALLGVEYRKDQNQWFQADASGFPSVQLEYLSAASTIVSASGQASASATFSQFGKLGYSYKGKYIFNYTVRRDGSSRFGANNKYGIFNSVQFAWNVKDESFLKNVKAISGLKFRYSYGQAGNDQIGNTLYAQLYGATRLYGGGSGIFPSQLGNPDLTWETRVEHNLGMELSLFNNRVDLTTDVYKRTNNDLLLSRSLYQTTGFSTIQQNLGSVENTGLEILLAVRPFVGKFKWESSFNIAFQKNKVKELYDGLTQLPGDASIRVGSPLGSFFTVEWAGVNPASGRSMWYDINGNLTYTPKAADSKIIGNIYPSHFGGWTNDFSYKGISLNAFFQYEYGRVRQDGQQINLSRNASTIGNGLTYMYDTRWQNPGDVVPTPRPFNGQTDYNSVSWATGTRYIYKTDYVRLKRVTLSYDVTAPIAKKLHLQGLRLYVQGVNLITYTEWPGYDPEFTGANTGTIPQTKSFTAGAQIRF